MASEPDLTEVGESGIINGFSREGSFFSLTSATSTYYSAKEELDSTSLYDTPAGSVGSGDLKMTESNNKSSKLIPQERLNRKGSSDSNSTTIEDPDSLEESLNECDHLAVDNTFSTLNSSISSENPMEVREDISRICNTMAESDDSSSVNKRVKIEKALKNGLLTELGELAISERGLLSNALRTRAWPLLLNVSPNDIVRNECKKIPNYFPDVPEKINNLVHLDVARVLKRFPPGLTDPQQDHLQLYLTNLICSVLQEKRKAYYYQGFHDISLTFLLVSISQSVPYLAYLCLNKMIETNLDPYMEKTMEKTHDVLHVLFALIKVEDPDLYTKIVVNCKCPVAFCLPWVLTWFSHTLPNDTDVFRLYDFILGSQEKLNQPYLIPIFISASLVLRNSKKIKSDESLNDIASMHHLLSRLPSELESQEPWLIESIALMKKYSGREEYLIKSGIEIKALQNKLWNEDTNNNRRRSVPVPKATGLVVSVVKFFFVRHRWTTASVVVLGTALLLQAKYGLVIYKLNALKSTIRRLQGYTPEPVRQFFNYWIYDDGKDE